MRYLKNTLTAICICLIALVASCSDGNKELIESSNELLEIDNRWTEITTYQGVYDGLPTLSIVLDGTDFSSASAVRARAFINANTSNLEQLRFDQDFVEISDELQGVKLALSEIYDQEINLFTAASWKPFQNHLNAKDFLEEYGDTPDFGRTLSQQWNAENFLSPWLDAQIKRKQLYERWLGILEKSGVDSATMSEFKTKINKEN